MTVRAALASLVILLGFPASSRAAPGDFTVAKVDDGLAYIAIGKKDGVAPGQALEVVAREGGEDAFHLGWIVLDSCGDALSLARVPIDLDKRVKQGTIVRLPSGAHTKLAAVAATPPAPSTTPSAAEPAAPVPPPAPTESGAAQFRHQGPTLVPPGVPLTLSVYAPEPLSNPVLMYRAAGEHAYEALPFRPQADSYYTAAIPAESVQAPGLEYYIVVDDEDAPRQLAYANPQKPAEVAVEGRFNETAELARYGVRDELSGTTELVSYRSRNGTSDYYYRAEGEYLHRIFKNVYSMRFGAGYLAGSAFTDATNKVDARFLYAHTEAEFRGSEVPIAFIPRLIFGVNRDGVGGGFEARMRIGDELGMNFEGGITVLSKLGFETFTQLTLHPIPKTSIALAAYLENLPVASSLGFRSFIDLRYRIAHATWAQLRGGVAARSIDTIGPDTGAGLVLGF